MTRAPWPTLAAVTAVVIGAGALFATGGRHVPVVPARAGSEAVATGDRDTSPLDAHDAATATSGRSTGTSPQPSRDNAGEPAAVASAAPPSRTLDARRLLLPVPGLDPGALTPGFDQVRGEGRHEAIDLMAPRGTPVLAVDDGRVEKLFTSKAGGLTIYQFDPERQHAYYYAHLDRYAEGLHDGQAVTRGQLLGYVGTTGNAPPDAPHLHFAIFTLGEEKRWWQGTAIDPYPLLSQADTPGS